LAVEEAHKFSVPSKPDKFSQIISDFYSGRTMGVLIKSVTFVVGNPTETINAKKSADIAKNEWINLSKIENLSNYEMNLKLEVMRLYDKYLNEKNNLPTISKEVSEQSIKNAGKGMIICCQTKQVAVEGIINLGRKLVEVRINATANTIKGIDYFNSINESIESRIIRLKIYKYNLETALDNLNKSRSSNSDINGLNDIYILTYSNSLV
jgi:hypothetical protein